jgi:DNA repair protein RadA/Sms
VLARHAGVGCGQADVFVNVVGGVRIDEPGADLAVALAVASAARGVALEGRPGARGPMAGQHGAGGHGAVGHGAPMPLACFGELGLTGELRSVAHADRRLAEAQKFGLREVIEPTRHVVLRRAVGAALGAGERSAQLAA